MDLSMSYYHKLSEKACLWLKVHRTDLLRDLSDLLRIPCIAQTQENPEAPYGLACRQALDFMLQRSQSAGLEIENFENRIGMATLPGTCTEAKPIRIWNHLDVVPIGAPSDWIIGQPFEPSIHHDYLICRGADDNKGPALGMLYMLQALKEIGFQPKHSICLCFGTDEERGMSDVLAWREKDYSSAVNIVADAMFPVCFAEKGMIEADLISKVPTPDILTFSGSDASNIVPGQAEIQLKGKWSCDIPDGSCNTDGIITVLHTEGISGHSAFPSGTKNALLSLCQAVSRLELPTAERDLFDFFSKILKDPSGATAAVASSDEISGETTCIGTMAAVRDGHVLLHLNIRYVVSADGSKLCEQLQKVAEQHGCSLEYKISEPNLYPRENPVVDELTKIYNTVTGSSTMPLVLAGGTYARKLPNAFAYGLGILRPKDPGLFPPGHGGAHQCDEALFLPDYFQAIDIMTKAIIKADQILP